MKTTVTALLLLLVFPVPHNADSLFLPDYEETRYDYDAPLANDAEPAPAPYPLAQTPVQPLGSRAYAVTPHSNDPLRSHDPFNAYRQEQRRDHEAQQRNRQTLDNHRLESTLRRIFRD